MSKDIYSLVFAMVLSLTITAQQATIVTWNTLNFSTTASSTARIPYFQTVLDSLAPDILVVQEIQGDAGANQFHTAVLENAMAMAPFVDGYQADNALFYNPNMFDAIANIPILTELRNISQFVMVHLNSGDTLRIFSVHLKASPGGSNQNARLAEVDSLRKCTDALSADVYSIVCGDFNIYSSNEYAYQRLINPEGETGYFIDPLPEMPGTWNNPDYAPFHTQSPRLRSFGGGASGGLDDRFDMILFSSKFSTNEGIAYVENSTVAIGNDGQHYNDSINAMPNTAVSQEMAHALHYATDHLPVMATIEFFNSTTTVLEHKQTAVLVYPNPSHGVFNLDLPTSSESTTRVTDTLGRTVHMESGRGVFRFDLSHLPSGMYYLNVVTETEKEVYKLILY